MIITKKGKPDMWFKARIHAQCPYCDCKFIAKKDEFANTYFYKVIFTIDDRHYCKSKDNDRRLTNIPYVDCPWCHQKVYFDHNYTLIKAKELYDGFEITNPTNVDFCIAIDNEYLSKQKQRHCNDH